MEKHNLISGEDYKALLPFRAGALSIDDDNLRIKHLISENYLEPSEYCSEWYTEDEIVTTPIKYRLSIKGIDALEMYEKVRKQHTDDNAEKIANVTKQINNRHLEWRFAIISGVILTIVDVLLTLFVEHFSAIMAFIKSIFHIHQSIP